MKWQPDRLALYLGIVRVEPIRQMVYDRKWRIGWRVWFQNGSHWIVTDEKGWRQVWGPVEPVTVQAR